jgi:hypothetical protein
MCLQVDGMLRTSTYALLFLVGGATLALHVSHWLLPVTAPLAPVSACDGWISTPSPAHHGYFRQTLEVPFRPEHAWIAVAADEYLLYVNGVKVGGNIHLVQADSAAFQGGLLEQSQRLTLGVDFPLSREAVLKGRGNEEWRMVQFYNIRAHLTEGRNTIAIYAASERPEDLAVAVHGIVSAGPLERQISGQAGAWRAASESTVRRGKYWYDPAYDDVDWGQARPQVAPADKPLFASADPNIWMKPFQAEAITDPEHGKELIFRAPLPAHGARSGWLRVHSSWPCQVFVGATRVGEGEGAIGMVHAYDISQYLAAGDEYVTIRVYRTTDPTGQTNASAEVPWLAVDGRVGSAPFSSGPGWSCLASYHPDYLEGAGEWRPVATHRRTQGPLVIRLKVPNIRTRSWFWLWLALAAAATALLAAGTWVLSKCFEWSGAVARGGALRLACWLLAPALAGILLEEVLRLRFEVSDTQLFFLAPGRSKWLLLTGPLLFLLSVAVLLRPVRRPHLRHLAGAAGRVPTWLWLTALVLVGTGLRLYAMDFQPPNADEYTSWDAARGILRTGVPQASSGIYYTRSPLYHYSLAGWLAVFGDSVNSARWFTLLPGVAVIPAMYCLVYAISRRRYLGLFATVILTVDPWQLGAVNLIRFYQQMQFFSVVTTLLFLRGFIWRQGKLHQNLFFVSATAGTLSQEVFATAFAPFLLAFLICYRPFSWKRDLNVWLGFGAMMTIILLDVKTFGTICMTPHVAIGTRSESLFVLHFTDLFGGVANIVTLLTTEFFWMNNGANCFFSVLFFAGLVYQLWHPNRAVLLLHAVVIVSIFLLTVLVVPVNTRYCYGLYPLLVAAALLSTDAMIRHAGKQLLPAAGSLEFLHRRRRWGLLLGALVVAGWAVNGEFLKVAESYDREHILDYQSALNYVAERKRPGDKVMAMRTPAVAVLLGQVDYYALPAMRGNAFDGIYLRPDGMVDRWSGGKLVWKVDQYKELFHNQDRVWIVVDEFRMSEQNPGVRDYLYQCCTVEYEFFGGQVLLWDRAAGRSASFPDRGGAADSY